MVDVLLGLQWGDEGKGKIADFLTPKYDIVARFQGGPNAGHSLEINGMKHVLNTIPSGIFHDSCINLIGNGVVIDPILLRKEIEKLLPLQVDAKKNLYFSRKAHLILPTHRLLDAASESSKGDRKIGSTLRGISPSYQDKIGRSGLRVGDMSSPDFRSKYEEVKKRHLEILKFLQYSHDLESLEKEWFEATEFLNQYIQVDGEYYINQQMDSGKKILAEGAQGSMLDIDFGTYPYVTSSNTITAGSCTGLGLAPQKIGRVFGIFKAYCTRVGSGPFPSELDNEEGESLRQKGHEFGAVSGRPRRCGWIDLPALKYAIMLNGVTDLIMTKSDVLSGLDQVGVCTGYVINNKLQKTVPYDLSANSVKPHFEYHEGWKEDLSACRSESQFPQTFKNYIQFLETELGLPISIISVGSDREQTVVRSLAMK